MEDFLYVDHLLHDLGLAQVSRDAVKDEDVDVRFEFMCVHCGMDRLFPKFDRDVVWDELAFARIFEERFANFRARINGAEHIATRAMKKTRDGAEGFALCAFATAGRAEEDERPVFHEGGWFIP